MAGCAVSGAGSWNRDRQGADHGVARQPRGSHRPSGPTNSLADAWHGRFVTIRSRWVAVQAGRAWFRALAVRTATGRERITAKRASRAVATDHPGLRTRSLPRGMVALSRSAPEGSRFNAGSGAVSGAGSWNRDQPGADHGLARQPRGSHPPSGPTNSLADAWHGRLVTIRSRWVAVQAGRGAVRPHSVLSPLHFQLSRRRR
jgi:hypothetical protein